MKTKDKEVDAYLVNEFKDLALVFLCDLEAVVDQIKFYAKYYDDAMPDKTLRAKIGNAKILAKDIKEMQALFSKAGKRGESMIKKWKRLKYEINK